MFKLFKNTFKTTNEGIILTVPLILFMCLVSLYLNYSREVVDTLPEFLLAGVTLLFMVSAFCAGWFYMVKKCVEFSKKEFVLDQDKANESSKLIQCFSDGIGKYFLTAVVGSIMFVIIVFSMGYLLYSLSLPIVKDIHFTLSQMSMVLISHQDITKFLNSLQPEQFILLFKLNFLLLSISSLFSFSTMLWVPEIMYAKRNPVTALFTSIGKVFSKFGKSLLVFVYITMLNFLISFTSPFAFLNPVTYIIVMSLYFYFIVYMVVLIFSYYDKEFNGQIETESDSDSRSDG